jgi:leader peptidase (prepilin peptidase)/N-methyltransferase
MLQTQSWLVVLAAALLGAATGSFLNVCIVRWPDGESVVRPRSKCPRCGTGVRARDNVPVLSWLALRGRCRGCRAPISPLYPAVELATALGWVATALALGPTFDALRLAVFGTVLLGIAATDARRMVIPDGFTVFLFVWTLVTSIASHGTGGATLFAPPYEALVGACTGRGRHRDHRLARRARVQEGGDGLRRRHDDGRRGRGARPERALLTVVVGACVGAVASVAVLAPVAWVTHRQKVAAGGAAGGEAAAFELPPVPFGVFLAPAALLTLLFGDRMIAWYFAAVLP